MKKLGALSLLAVAATLAVCGGFYVSGKRSESVGSTRGGDAVEAVVGDAANGVESNGSALPGEDAGRAISASTSEAGGGQSRRTLYWDRPEEQPLTGSVLEDFDRLHERYKAGDSAAAYLLFRMLDACFQLDVGIAGFLDYPELDCAGLEASHYLVKWDALEFAADRGNTSAMVSYLGRSLEYGSVESISDDLEGFSSYRKKAMGYLATAAEAGDLYALALLAGQYQEGYLVERDLVASYAYFYALSLAAGRERWGSTLSFLEHQLDPVQIEQARRQGSVFFRKNYQA